MLLPGSALPFSPVASGSKSLTPRGSEDCDLSPTTNDRRCGAELSAGTNVTAYRTVIDQVATEVRRHEKNRADSRTVRLDLRMRRRNALI